MNIDALAQAQESRKAAAVRSAKAYREALRAGSGDAAALRRIAEVAAEEARLARVAYRSAAEAANLRSFITLS
jgi:hypothetical protein